jgi:hypothetical protein
VVAALRRHLAASPFNLEGHERGILVGLAAEFVVRKELHPYCVCTEYYCVE